MPRALVRSFRGTKSAYITTAGANASCRAFSTVRPTTSVLSTQNRRAAPALSRSLATTTTTKALPEFDLTGKVVLVSGAARGLGLVQAEALMEAGATGM